ncbi:MAG: hypothetical protein J7K23_06810 [Thermoproteales archaeon]|nr:hypothetical protein [Thermoproteales archaeon]
MLSEYTLRKIKRYIQDIFNEKLLAALFILVISLSVSGFTYVLVYKPPPMTTTGVIAPGLDRETSSESILVTITYILGLFGLYLVYIARQHIHNPKYMSLLLIAGSLISALVIIMLLTVYNMKI